MAKQLKRAFFARDTHMVAKDLLGKLLVRRWRGQILAGRINEVESYVGENDLACHAAKGRTKRTEVMFGEAGHAYVYLVYGMYCCLNVVTEEKGFPAAVLIRGLMSFHALPVNKSTKQIPHLSCTADSYTDKTRQMIVNGPGKLCRAMHISRAQNDEDLTTSNKLWLIDDGYKAGRDRILTTPRIGVEYAGKDALLPWRYVLPAKN
ncbi:MAG: DNA-3-methyladenine glycosylase [Patescibacteria group bacterium]